MDVVGHIGKLATSGERTQVGYKGWLAKLTIA